MTEEKRWISAKLLFSAVSEQLAENRQAAFTVTGMSMWPFICHGRDRVIVGKVDRENLKIGDIVLFQVTEEKYILHRITHLGEGVFQTTGDGNLFRDMPMSYHSIVARVDHVIRKGKNIDCNSIKWKMLSRIWMALFPARKWMFRIWFSIREKIRR